MLHKSITASDSELPYVGQFGDQKAFPMSRRQWLMVSGAAVALATTGCTKWSKFVPMPRQGSFKLLAPSGYFSKALIDRFLAETGYEVIIEDVPPDNKIVGLFEAGSLQCDLMMPSAFQAKTLISRNYLQPFDHSLLSRGLLPLVNAAFYNPYFDLHNKYVIPYTWGSTGIGYDSERVDGLPVSWGTLFSGAAPPLGPKQPNGFGPITKIVLLDDARFTLGAVLLYLNYVPNTLNPRQIEEAADLLVRLNKQSGKATPEGNSYYELEYKTNEIPDLLRSSEVALSMAWSGDIVLAMNSSPSTKPGNTKRSADMPGNSRLRLALPVEGSILFRDSFMIPSNADAANLVGVHKFIEFLLQPKNAAEVSEYSYYATTVAGASAYVDRFIANGASFFYNPAGKDYFLEDVGVVTQYYDKAWERVKASAPGFVAAAPTEETEPEATIVFPKLPDAVSI
jgi:spermidine/putrescine transport system substrate-binding protein